MKTTQLSLCAVLVAGLAAGAGAADKPKAAPVKEAVAVIMPTKKSDGKTTGTVTLTQHKGYVQLTGEVSGLSPGEHGFHIHMYGDVRAADGTSAGGHYNPDGAHHGGPASKEHHSGDLGNIVADSEGVAKIDVKGEGLKLRQILGRSIVVHGGVDDLKSDPAGNAGPRVGIGVIGMAETKTATAAK